MMLYLFIFTDIYIYLIQMFLASKVFGLNKLYLDLAFLILFCNFIWATYRIFEFELYYFKFEKYGKKSRIKKLPKAREIRQKIVMQLTVVCMIRDRKLRSLQLGRIVIKSGFESFQGLCYF